MSSKGKKEDTIEIFGGHRIKVHFAKKGKKGRDKKDVSEGEKYDMISNGTLLKKGRHFCDCEGLLHKIITNCQNCGKIVCEQEGYGSCLFCKVGKVEKINDVLLYPESFDLNNEDTHIDGSVQNEELNKALKRKNLLIYYDKSFEKRSRVIDDQVDYYESETNQWLSKEEKQVLQKKEEKIRELKEVVDRPRLKFLLDFAGRNVSVNTSYENDEKDELIRLQNELKERSAMGNTKSDKKSIQLDNVKTVYPNSKGNEKRISKNPLILNNDMNLSISKNESKKAENPILKQKIMDVKKRTKVQHDYFESESNIYNELDDKKSKESNVVYENVSKDEDDVGKCMSMHQPWASLLIEGIKRHEGRTWYSDFRGRLWIASTKQEPAESDIEELKEKYSSMGRTNFPKVYPVSCLLGCVDVVDIAEQDEYQKKTLEKDKESVSPFVFLCKNPRKLYVPLPIKGQPKIYDLTDEQWNQAKEGLKPL